MKVRLSTLLIMLLIAPLCSAQSLSLSSSWAEDCNGNCDAYSVITAGSGTAPFQYSSDYGVTWQTNDTISNLCAGNQSVWVQDATLTLDSILFDVYPLGIFNVDTIIVVNGSGGGACDGMITINLSGGFPPYQYKLDAGTWQSSSIFSGVCPGMHNVYFRDTTAADCSGGGGGGGGTGGACDTLAFAFPSVTGEVYRGCGVGGSSSGSAAVGVGDGPLSVTGFGDNEECGCDALVTASATGGVPPYQFDFDGFGFSGSQFTNLGCSPASNITVMDALGNTATTTTPVGFYPYTIDATSTVDVTCFGFCDGEINAITNAPYLSIDGGVSWTTSTFISGLCPGNYDIIGTDDPFTAMCYAFASFTIFEPAPLASSYGTNDASCGLCNGAMNIAASGGVPPYNFDIGGTNNTSGSFSNLCAGSYSVVITDINGCTSFENIDIFDVGNITASFNSIDVFCYGWCDGQIDVTASGGTAPYTYDIGVASNSNGTFTGLCTGSYPINVTDANGCTVFVGTANIVEPQPIFVSNISTDVLCNGGADGTIDISAFGGGSFFMYSIDGGLTFSGNNFFSNLPAGSYSIVVMDFNGCMEFDFATIFEPAPLSVASATTDPLCNGGTDGTIDITPIGGSSPYAFSIDNGTSFSGSNFFSGLTAGSYDIVVMDINGCVGFDLATLVDPPALSLVLKTDSVSCFGSCDGIVAATVFGGTTPYSYDWSGLSTNDSLINVCAGTYGLTVTDANGCTISSSASIFEPTPLVMSGTVTHATNSGACDGGVIITASGSNPPYQFSLDTGSTWQSTGSYGALCPDTIILMVTDAKGCTISDTVYIGIGGNVWPGDANFDGIANNLDYLYLGFAFGDAGPARATPSILWQAWPATDWNQFFQTNINHKHADCEGTGTVDEDDTTAIISNYNLTHATPPPLINNANFNHPAFTLLPQLDTVSILDTLRVDIFLGLGDVSVDSIYGTSFSIGYDTSIVQPGSAWITYGPGWFGTPGLDVMTLSYDDWNNNRIDGALTRIDHQNTNGLGWIGTLHVVMPDDISGKKALLFDTLNLYLNRISAFDALENKLELQEDSVAIIVKQFVEGIASYQNSMPPLKIYPVPATESITVELPCSGERIELLDVSGRLIEGINVSNNSKIEINVQGLNRGVYQLRYHCDYGVATGRFLKE